MSRAYVGDEVFFHHNGVPKSGLVKSVGRHGCIVEHEKTPHRLKWDNIKGHKSRAPQNYNTVEVGEDGMIVENDKGVRRFIGVPHESKDGYMLKDPNHNAHPNASSQG